MGLFSGLFGNSENRKKEEKILPWIALTGKAQLEEIELKSKSKPQLIFKHSTTCGISRMVLRSFTDSFDFGTEQMDIYYLDLHAYRDVSNEVAYKFQVIHQSPQLLLIENDTVIVHDSHGGINDIDLRSYI